MVLGFIQQWSKKNLSFTAMLQSEELVAGVDVGANGELGTGVLHVSAMMAMGHWQAPTALNMNI